MKRQFIWLLGLLLSSGALLGIPQHIDVSTIQNKLWLAYNAYAHEDSADQLTIGELAPGLLDTLFSPINQRIFNVGYNGHAHWVAFKLRNPTDTARQLTLEIQGPNINRVRLYEVSQGAIHTFEEAGMDVPYQPAVMVNGNYRYQMALAGNTEKRYYIWVQNNVASLRMPMLLWERNSYNDYLTKSSYVNGGFVGIMLLIIVFAATAFLMLKDTLYLWYLLYIIGLLGFMLHGFGLFFRFLHPGHPQWNDTVTVTISLVALASVIRFSEVFLNLSARSRVGKIIIQICYALLIIMFGYWFFRSQNPLVSAVLLFIYSLIPAISFGTFAWLAIRGSLRGDRDSLIYISALAPLIFMSMAIVLRNHNLFPHLPFFSYRIPIGFTFEAVVFFFALVYRFKLINDEKEALLLKLNEVQTQLFRKVIEAVEDERKRIAIDLHDGLGQMLSTVKLNLSAVQDDIPEEEKTAYHTGLKLLDEACSEVRHISHNMMPSTLIRLGLVSALKESAANISRSGKLKVHVDVAELNKKLPEAREIALYRVCQEVLNNAIKYAEARQVYIKLWQEDNVLRMSITDDGKGFETKLMTTSSGIGWSNIYSRISMLGGRVNVQSILGAGTTVEVELPIW